MKHLTVLFSFALISYSAIGQVYNSTDSSSNGASGEVTLYRATIEAFNRSDVKNNGSRFSKNFNKNIFNDARGSCVYLKPNGELALDQAQARDNPWGKSQTKEIFQDAVNNSGDKILGFVALSNIAYDAYPSIAKKRMNYNQAVSFLTNKINQEYKGYEDRAYQILVEDNGGSEETTAQIFFRDPGGVDAEKAYCTTNNYRVLPQSVFKQVDIPVKYGAGIGLIPASAGSVSEAINYKEGPANSYLVDMRGGIPLKDAMWNTYMFVDDSGKYHYWQNLTAELSNRVGNKVVKSPLMQWETNNIYTAYSLKYEGRQLTLFKNNQVWFAENAINGQRLSLNNRSESGANTTQKRGE